MEVEPKNNKQKLGIVFLGIALLLLVFTTPSRSVGYFIGSFLAILVPWTLILGIIAYGIWRFGFKKRKKLFLFIFSILFLSAAIFQFASDVFEGYVMQKVSDIPLEEFLPGTSLSNASSTITNNWFAYTSNDDGFSILFPKEPILHSDHDILLVEGSDLTYDLHSFETDDGRSSFWVFKYIYSDYVDFTNQDQALEDLLNVTIDIDTNSQLISSDYTYQSHNRALNFLMKNGEEMMRGRWIIVDQTPYLIAMNYFPVNYSEQTYNKFVNSFEIQ